MLTSFVGCDEHASCCEVLLVVIELLEHAGCFLISNLSDAIVDTCSFIVCPSLPWCCCPLLSAPSRFPQKAKKKQLSLKTVTMGGGEEGNDASDWVTHSMAAAGACVSNSRLLTSRPVLCCELACTMSAPPTRPLYLSDRVRACVCVQERESLCVCACMCVRVCVGVVV